MHTRSAAMEASTHEGSLGQKLNQSKRIRHTQTGLQPLAAMVRITIRAKVHGLSSPRSLAA